MYEENYLNMLDYMSTVESRFYTIDAYKINHQCTAMDGEAVSMENPISASGKLLLRVSISWSYIDIYKYTYVHIHTFFFLFNRQKISLLFPQYICFFHFLTALFPLQSQNFVKGRVKSEPKELTFTEYLKKDKTFLTDLGQIEPKSKFLKFKKEYARDYYSSLRAQAGIKSDPEKLVVRQIQKQKNSAKFRKYKIDFKVRMKIVVLIVL